MAVKYTNNAKTTLASGLTNSATSATVTDGSAFPSLGAGEYFYITFDDGSNNEIAKVTARSGNTLTIVRAQDNTSARAFSTGDSAELRVIAAVLTEIQENIAAKSANQTVYSATAASNATDYNIGVDPGVEANASVFLDGVYQHHDTFSFSGSTLTFDAAPTNGTKIEVVVDNLINLQSSNLTVDTFTATSGQTAFTLSDAPGGESNVLAFIDGVFQNQASFTLSSNTLTFDTGVVVGRSVTVYIINPVNIGTPSDNTVTSAKLSGNITLPGSLTVGAYDVAFDSPTFVVDNANSRVGIGTASPSTGVLDIVGDVTTSSHINIGGNLIKGSGDLTLDVAGDIYLDSDNANWRFNDAGTAILHISKPTGAVRLQSSVADADIIFGGIDGSTVIEALTLDMSEAGAATFNSTLNSRAITITDGTTNGASTIGSASDELLLDTNADTGLTIRSGASSTGVVSFASPSDHNIGQVYYDHNTNSMVIKTNDAIALTINSSQNATFAGGITSSGNLHAGDGTNISMDGSANGQLEVDGNGYQGAIALDGSAMHLYHNSSSRDLVLGTNETARLTIGGTGTFTFHSNNLQSIGTISSGAIQIGDSLGSGYGITVDPNTQYGAIVQTTESTPSANPNLWCRIDDDGTVSTLFRVQNNGLVGIGGTTSDYPLDISYQAHGLYNQHRPSSGVGVGQEMYYSFNTSNGTEETFSSIYSEIKSNTDGAESGAIALRAKNAGGLDYVLRGDGGQGVKLYGAGTEYWSLDSSGNVLHQGGSPEYHFGTSSASHTNWRIAVQELVSQGFEIASGTTSAGANAASDTYTTRFQITSDGEVKLPGTTSHTYMHIAANSGVAAANKYTSGSTTFTAGMDTAAGIPDNMYGIVSGSNKALIADSSARVTVGHGNPNGLGKLSVHGTVGHGNVIGDPDISKTYTNVTSVDASTIELVSGTAFTISSGDTCVVTWNKGSWASVMYDAQIAFASGGAHQTGSFYHNNSGSGWSGHVAKEHYDNTGVTWISYGGSNQTVIWTFTFPGGYHPIVKLKVTAGGGSGYVAANEFSIVWTT